MALGAPVAGAPVAGAPVAGAPVAGAPVAGAPVAGAPVAQPDPRTQNFYDIIGDTSGGAIDRFTRMMDTIEEFSDLAPAAQMRADIMDSDKMKGYMESRGLKDPDLAFRLMNREARMIRKNTRRHDRKQFRKLRKQGIIGRDLSDAADSIAADSIAADIDTIPEQVTVDRAAERTRSSLDSFELEPDPEPTPIF